MCCALEIDNAMLACLPFTQVCVHKAATRERHHGLSVATPSRNSQVNPCSFISLSTVLLQVSFRLVSLSLPLFLRPSDVHQRATLGRDVIGIRSTCPIHFHRRIFTSWVIGFVVLMHCCMFKMVSIWPKYVDNYMQAPVLTTSSLWF